jgi:putative ABC transport system substrate-binding protein
VELVQLRVDAIVTRNTPATLAAKRATTTIPIVMAGSGDPVSTGLVSSLARPGGNVTGVAFLGAGLAAKRLELLKETIPSLTRVALLWNPTNPANVSYFNEAEAGIRFLGVSMQSVEVRNGEALTAAFATMTHRLPSALLITGDSIVQRYIDRIVTFAAKNRLPAMYNAKENVEAGGLMSYGANRSAIARRAAVYVDKILKGARAAELPVEQPTELELVINLKTARTLGLTIPKSVSLQADEVIE